MLPYNQFSSTLNNFRATLIPENLIGCDFIFNVYNLNTNLRVGRIDGSNGEIQFSDTDAYLSANQLKEIANLCSKVADGCLAFQ